MNNEDLIGLFTVFINSEPIKSAERLAVQTIRQWEDHDCYRVQEGDKVLFDNGREPNDVMIARTLIASLDMIRLAKKFEEIK